MKKLNGPFSSIDPEILDNWFEEKMRKYSNSNTYNHLLATYNMLIGNTIHDDSLATYYDKEMA